MWFVSINYMNCFSKKLLYMHTHTTLKVLYQIELLSQNNYIMKRIPECQTTKITTSSEGQSVLKIVGIQSSYVIHSPIQHLDRYLSIKYLE